ncbi:MAG: hypothetical protein NTU59_02305 [Coprothermobacterota bacterium]|nr:hypothetical protein [Coprothermobacterota bacterium]
MTSPNGGETWAVGESRAIQWSSSGVSGNVVIELSRNGGSAWETLFDGTANDGSQSWTVAGAVSTTCRVRVTSVNSPEANDTSDGNFAIGSTPPPSPTISVTSPNGGETWALGSNHAITWTSANLTGNVVIELSHNGGSAWETLFAGTANDGSQSWTVAGAVSTTCRVRVTSVSSPEAHDTSDGNFTIGGTPPADPPILSLPSPNLDFGTAEGQKALTVRNEGGADLHWNATSPADWISASAASGTIGPHSEIELQIFVNRTGKSPGIYQTEIAFSSDGGSQNAGVQMEVPQPQPSPTIDVLNPNGGESWTVGESRAIQWSSANLSGNVIIELSRNGGSAWETLFAGTANDGNQSWTVTGPVSTACRVRVTSVNNGTVLDTSNANFQIESAVHEFTFHLLQNWNMISLPLTTSASPSAVFGGLPVGWMIFSWNPLIPGYVMNDQVTLETGKGYWLKSPNALNYVVSGERFNQSKTVPLAVGWNMVGLPYLEDVNWGDVHIRAGGVTYTLDQAADAGVIVRYLFWWNGSQYQTANEVGKLEPGKGYWLQAKQSCELLFSPGGVTPPPPPPGNP